MTSFLSSFHRLNFLTPRYVNRKGVALPTSSEETKRNKRENLEQKQVHFRLS
jgi:hypothetical protein